MTPLEDIEVEYKSEFPTYMGRMRRLFKEAPEHALIIETHHEYLIEDLLTYIEQRAQAYGLDYNPPDVAFYKKYPSERYVVTARQTRVCAEVPRWL